MNDHRWLTAFVIVATLLSSTGALAQTAEGIRVSAQWTIDVRNPDGSVAAHRRFRNHLLHEGKMLIALLLEGRRTGSWMVAMGPGLDGPNPCGASGSTPAPILDDTTTLGYSSWRPHCFVERTYDRPEIVGDSDWTRPPNTKLDFGANSALFEVRGSLTVDTVGTISQVSTSVDGIPFSGTRLATPISVTAGQIVQFRVEFSFQ